MSLLPGTPVAAALGPTCSMVPGSDSAGNLCRAGDLYGSQLQMNIQKATGMNVDAEQGSGLRSTFNSKGVGVEQPKVPVAAQPDMRPDLVASQNMSLSNG